MDTLTINCLVLNSTTNSRSESYYLMPIVATMEGEGGFGEPGFLASEKGLRLQSTKCNLSSPTSLGLSLVCV